MDQIVKNNPLAQLLRDRTQGKQAGIWSCCSANEYVIRAAMRRAKATNTVLLVEATANQVNQEGGYTGMTPVDFLNFLRKLAWKEGLPMDRVFCGGDHLGPLTWQTLPEKEAMAKAIELVKSYVEAGFIKIHLDTSMRVADDDKTIRLSDATIARRGAELCAAAEEAFARRVRQDPSAIPPVYVIGSEVPIPGGAQENEDSVAVTTVSDCIATLNAFQNAFAQRGLDAAWSRVIGLVVQPGVEFADESVIAYNREEAKELTSCLKKWPTLVFEGHSTDYQPRECLKQMVEDGIAILKVGPALTFGLREGLFALEMVEKELAVATAPSHFRETLETAMLADDRKWVKYYHGTPGQQAYARAFSYSDRARYYLPEPSVSASIKRLLDNFENVTIPAALLSEYLPRQYTRVREGTLQNRAEDILMDHIGDWIDDYLYATVR